MNIFEFKLIAIVVIFLVGVSSGLFPLRFAVSKGKKLLFSLGNSLAGGIFLGAALLHLLPDAVVHFQGVFEYPLEMLLAATSLGILLFLEKVVFIQHEAHNLDEIGKPSSLSPYLLALILTIHSFIAGAALGIEKTMFGSAALFVAIIAHKGGAAFALGINMIKGAIHKSRHIKVILLFSAMTPLGIVLGSLLSRGMSSSTGQIVEGIFDSLAAGTFLYIAVLDIIEEEFSIPGNELLKFISIIAGLGLMALLALWS
jgi:zinc transporter 1/2/3